MNPSYEFYDFVYFSDKGIHEYRSDENDRKKPSYVTKVAGKEKPLQQRQKSVNIDCDMANFLLKRGKCSEDLKGQLSCFGAELQILKSGLIKIKEVNGNTIPNWEERCVKAVNVFCDRFHKKYFLLENEIRDSIPEALSTLQKDVSSTGGACWLDKHKQNLILVSPNDEFTKAEKEVEKFIENVRRFAQKSFKIEENIHELVRKDLPSLKEALKSCNITLKKKTLVVVCLRNEIDNVAEKVESFLQKLQGVKQNGNIFLCCVAWRCVVLCVDKPDACIQILIMNTMELIIRLVRFIFFLRDNLLYPSPLILLRNYSYYQVLKCSLLHTFSGLKLCKSSNAKLHRIKSKLAPRMTYFDMG